MNAVFENAPYGKRDSSSKETFKSYADLAKPTVEKSSARTQQYDESLPNK